MLFPKVKEIEEQYEMGEVLEPGELDGEYFVIAPWFPWLSLELLNHRKAVNTFHEGDNVILDDTRFGRFKLVKEDESLLIDYNQPENAEVMKRVVDRLRRLPDGRIIGKLYYRLLGQEIFLMYFEMKQA